MHNNININNSASNASLMKLLGNFIRHHRLEQNRTQAELAETAGINRTTLSQFERGTRVSMITFVQLLRALDQLHVLEVFKITEQISPLELAKLSRNKRKRASKNSINKVEDPGVDW